MKRAPDLGPTLRSWLQADERDLPAHVRTAVLSAVGSVPQRRSAWPVSVPSLARLRRAPAVLAVGLLAALLVAALAASLLLPLVGSPQPTAEPVPRLGTDIPEGAGSGMIDTPLGRARWVHLTGTPATLPRSLPTAWPKAWTRIVGDAPFTAIDWQPGGFVRWTSTDGMRWTSERVDHAVEAESVQPYEGPGASWLMTSQPPGLWRSTDGQAWHAIDLASIVPEGPAALEWQVELGPQMASTDDVTVVQVSLSATEPFESLDWPRWDPTRVAEVEEGLILISGVEAFDTPDRLLRFETVADGMRVSDDADGSHLADLKGVAYEDVLGWVRDGVPVERHVAVVDGDRLIPTFRLTGFGDGFPTSMGTMLGTDDAILALILATPHGPAHLWRTEDGRAWTDLGPWDIPDGEPGGAFWMGAAFGRFHVEYHSPGAANLQRAWRSPDGREWELVVDDVPADANLYELASGVIAQQWLEDGVALWTSADGRTWEPLELSGMGLTIDDTEVDFGAVGDTYFVQPSGDRDLWILSFDTVPE